MEHGSFEQPTEGEVFEVESIIDYEIGEMGKKYFRVRWKGYGSEDDTWEPDSNLLTCGNLVKEFMRSHKRKKKKKRRKEEKEQARHMRTDSQGLAHGISVRTSAGQILPSSSQSAEHGHDSKVSLDEVLGDSLGLTRQSRKELERVLAESRLTSVRGEDTSADQSKSTDPAVLSSGRLEPGKAFPVGGDRIEVTAKEQPALAHIKQESDEDSQDSSEHAQPVRGKLGSRKRLLIADSSSESEPDEETKGLLIKWGERRFSSEDFAPLSRKEISMGRRSKPSFGEAFGGRSRGLSETDFQKEDAGAISSMNEPNPLSTNEGDVFKENKSPLKMDDASRGPGQTLERPWTNPARTDGPMALQVKPALTPTKVKERSSTPTVEDIRKSMDTGGLMQSISTLKHNLTLGGKGQQKDKGPAANDGVVSRTPTENHGLPSVQKGGFVSEPALDASSDFGKTTPVEKENPVGSFGNTNSASSTGVAQYKTESTVPQKLEAKDSSSRLADMTTVLPAENVTITQHESMIRPTVHDAVPKGLLFGAGHRNERSPPSTPSCKTVASDRSMMKGNMVLFPLGRVPGARALSTCKEDILRRLSAHEASKEWPPKVANLTSKPNMRRKSAGGSLRVTHGLQPSEVEGPSVLGVGYVQTPGDQSAAVQMEGRAVPGNFVEMKAAEMSPLETDVVRSVATAAVLGGKVASDGSSVTSEITKTVESCNTSLDRVVMNSLSPIITQQAKTTAPVSPSSSESVRTQLPCGPEGHRFPRYETDAISSRAPFFHSQRSLDSTTVTNPQQDCRSDDFLRKRTVLGKTLPNRQWSWSIGDPPEPKALLPQSDSAEISLSPSISARERGTETETNVSVPSSFVVTAQHGHSINARLRDGVPFRGSPKPRDGPERRLPPHVGPKLVSTELSAKETATSTTTLPLGDAGIHLEFTKFHAIPTEPESIKPDTGVSGLPALKSRQQKGMRTVKKLTVVHFEPPKQDILGELLGPHDEKGNVEKGSSEKSEESSREMTEKQDSPAFQVSESESEGDLELELECLDLEEEGLVGSQQRIYHDFNDKLRVVQPIKLTHGELKAAVVKNRLDRVLGALAAHNDPDVVDRETDKSLLMLAIAYGNKDIARALLWGGADPNYQTRDGTTALMLAVEKGDRALISSLVLNGAYIETQKPNGESALTIACNQGFPDVVVLLLNHGADAKLLSAAPATPVSVQQHLVRAIIEKHNERLRELVEHFLSQFIAEFASVVKPAVLPCRCLSPRDNREQELYFEFNRNPCDSGISIVFLCLPAEFHQDGSIRIKVAEADSGVKSVSLNGKKQCQVIPGECSLHILFPNFGQVNHLCFRTVEPKYKLLVAVYAIQLKNELMRSMGLMGRY